jgi:hypothetical protein
MWIAASRPPFGRIHAELPLCFSSHKNSFLGIADNHEVNPWLTLGEKGNWMPCPMVIKYRQYHTKAFH